MRTATVILEYMYVPMELAKKVRIQYPCHSNQSAVKWNVKGEIEWIAAKHPLESASKPATVANEVIAQLNM